MNNGHDSGGGLQGAGGEVQSDRDSARTRSWRSAKSAGMKYIVITSKHHDGFAMFDSKANPFNIVQATPFKRDPLKELADGVPQAGHQTRLLLFAGPGLDGARRRSVQDRRTTTPPTHHWDPAQDGNFANYLHSKAIPQIKELLTNYGEFPAVIWFDTPTTDMTPELAGEIVAVLNEHPKLIWNNRLGGGYHGDTETPEQYIPAAGLSRTRLGVVHDDERHLGLQVGRYEFQDRPRRCCAT